MFKLLDVVAITHNDDEHGVKKGFIGTIVDVHAGGEAYTVEFLDDKGETIEEALFTDYKQEELVLVTR